MCGTWLDVAGVECRRRRVRIIATGSCRGCQIWEVLLENWSAEPKFFRNWNGKSGSRKHVPLWTPKLLPATG